MLTSTPAAADRSVVRESSQPRAAPPAVNGATGARGDAAAAPSSARRQELEDLAFQQTKPLRDMILVLEDKVRQCLF